MSHAGGYKSGSLQAPITCSVLVQRGTPSLEQESPWKLRQVLKTILLWGPGRWNGWCSRRRVRRQRSRDSGKLGRLSPSYRPWLGLPPRPPPWACKHSAGRASHFQRKARNPVLFVVPCLKKYYVGAKQNVSVGLDLLFNFWHRWLCPRTPLGRWTL